MALWMEPGAEPKTDVEAADLEAISALKQSAALELKEKGNEYVKMGKKHYSAAIDCYTRAINQKALSDAEQSILYSNRAQVNLLLGNYRRALQDAEEAIKFCPTNAKAFYRAAKASVSLSLLAEAQSYCVNGLQVSPDNMELKKLATQIDNQKSELEKREVQISKALADAKELASAFEDRKLRIGKPMYAELIGLKKPFLDKDNILHWPVLLLYPEVMSSDIIEDFCETDMFSLHLDIMFSDSSPALTWDSKHEYTRDALELFYEASSGVCLSKKELLCHLLQGTEASNLENLSTDEIDADKSRHNSIAGSWLLCKHFNTTVHKRLLLLTLLLSCILKRLISAASLIFVNKKIDSVHRCLVNSPKDSRMHRSIVPIWDRERSRPFS